MATQLGARHHECDLTTSPPPDGLITPSLAYGVFSSAREARESYDEAVEFELRQGGERCAKAASSRVAAGVPDGATVCYRREGYLNIWWSDDGSAVMGALSVGRETDTDLAVQAYERVLAAG